MLSWLKSVINPPEYSPPAAAPAPPEPKDDPPESDGGHVPAMLGHDPDKARALSSYEVKTRAAYACTMHGYHDLAHKKLSQREPLTPEVIEYAKGPGCETLRQLGQAMTILAEVAGEVRVPDGNGGQVTIKEQLAQFRTTFPEYGGR